MRPPPACACTNVFQYYLMVRPLLFNAGFRVQVLGFRFSVFGFRVQGSGVQGLGFRGTLGRVGGALGFGAGLQLCPLGFRV